MSGAAFFDLDRTLLKGASTPAIRKALAQVGLVSEKAIPGEGVFVRVYDVWGESLAHMALARLAAFACKGWDVEKATQAGELIAEMLMSKVAPYAPALIEEHRNDHRYVVLATTTPKHLVEPFARRLGFDDVIATTYEVRDGHFTGRLSGSFVWSGWKMSRVKSWAKNNSVSLKDSFAYSDSVYDVPLLSSVGHPFAVNPDNRLRALAIGRRWPIIFLDVPPGVPKFAGLEPFDVVAKIARPSLGAFARFEVLGAENIPKTGPVIVAANHRSYFDVGAVGILASTIGRPIRFLAKKEVMDAPVIGAVARAMGAIRVDRGSGSDRPLQDALRTLGSGMAIGIFPQGTIPRGEKFFEPKLVGKTGAVRLAQESGAPIVPVGIWGTENVWPRSARIPRVSAVLSPPLVTITVGEPITVDKLPNDVQQATTNLMDQIASLLPAEARDKIVPNQDQIRSALPPQ